MEDLENGPIHNAIVSFLKSLKLIIAKDICVILLTIIKIKIEKILNNF